VPQLEQLGLRENPFKDNVEQRYFYADQNRSQILENTEHLIDYSSNFQVIVGDSGMGKSHFLEFLSTRIDNNWRVAKIAHAEQMDTLSIIQAVLDAFGSIANDQLELLETLENQLADIAQLGFKPVLLVDSAQGLSVDALRFLIQLSQQKQDDEPYIHIVVFAGSEVIEHLQSAELRDYRDIIHIATLTHLDKQGVSAYLRHKMAVAGFDRESPFTPRIIDSIFNDSQGLPRLINFFADKFLSSSGKAENYIEQQAPNSSVHSAALSAEVMPENDSSQADNDLREDNLLESLDENILAEDRNDRAEQQLNRLTEQFEEIEQMGSQAEYAEPLLDDFADEADETKPALVKFMIPIALLAILVIAFLVINGVYDKAKQNEKTVEEEENIALLPLELPPEAAEEQTIVVPSPLTEKVISAKPPAIENETSLTKQEARETLKNEQQVKRPAVNELELIEVKAPVVAPQENTAEPESVAAIVKTDNESQPSTNKPIEASAAAIVVTAVEPEPVIGSDRRQYISFSGKNFSADTRLLIRWGKNNKEFSQKLTPKQWHYVNTGKIKLHLSTGKDDQQWQVVAINADSRQSTPVTFDVVRPFVSKMAIKAITPNPFVGSNKRQEININGSGFSQQTVMELRWDKNKKHFSSRLTPSQFEFVNPQQIKLFIATGVKKRKWTVVAISPDGNTSKASFSVIDKYQKMTSAAAAMTAPLKTTAWLKLQVNNYYTIQLFGSHQRAAIDELLHKYTLSGDLLMYTTERNGQAWYTLSYGSYATKEQAQQALGQLAPALSKTSWIRTFASIKEQLALLPTAKQSTNSTKQAAKPGLSSQKSKNEMPKIKNAAWIRKQNPQHYTLQLIALSSEAAVKNFIAQYGLHSQAAYFKKQAGDKVLYVLIYGRFADKSAAQDARQKLLQQFKNNKPWLRNFSAIQGMMSDR